jgi:predicted dehydrogenase
MKRFQVVHVFGSKGKIEIKHPFNCLDQEAILIVQQGSDIDYFSFEPANPYTLQADHFSKSIRTLEPLLIPVSDSLNNMRIIDQLRD